MDTPASAAPDEKTPPLELAVATEPRKEKSNPSGPLEISTERFQLFRRAAELKFDRRTSGISLRTPKNARIPEVRDRQRAAPNRQRVGRN